MGTPVEELVLDAASAALVTCAAWSVLTLTAGVWEHLRGAAPRALSAITPRLARRTVALVCGATLGALTAAPAGAAGAIEHERERSDAWVTGLALPERPDGRRPAPGPDLPVRHPATVTVAYGDSLWSLAQDRLPARAGPVRVDRAWRAVYAGNRRRIGADPDLLIPGTTLRLPPGLGPGPRTEARGTLAHDPRKDRP